MPVVRTEREQPVEPEHDVDGERATNNNTLPLSNRKKVKTEEQSPSRCQIQACIAEHPKAENPRAPTDQNERVDPHKDEELKTQVETRSRQDDGAQSANRHNNVR